jgi:CubicO group peptidase (beta-lactamase class C family)
MMLRRIAIALALPITRATAQQPDTSLGARIDRLFSASASSTAPGCAVGVSREGRSVAERAFGMADLEHDIANTPTTIFEAGSVSKQFTAASIVALAIDGKLRLDDPVRKHIPELPDYGAPLTIRHLLNHTSGIRDWGSVLGLTGFGRGDRVVSQALAMDVITHQRGIDFTPGSEYSYSNSGYTLLSTIAERVSGQTLMAFTDERFFKPLGMTNTQWRDDYQRLVPRRAQAYAPAAGGRWRLEMPFMNVYGNGGLLTTVADLLKWNAMLDARSLGAALVDSMERVVPLNSGRAITYGVGLTTNTYKGKRQVAHSGSTAGYQAYLTRFPESKVSVAVLCNSAATNPTAMALRVVDEVLGAGPAAVAAADTVTMPAAELAKRVALWRHTLTHLPARTAIENGNLRVVGGPVLRALRDGSFLAGPGPARWEFTLGSDGKPARATRHAGDALDHYVAETPWTPTAADLGQFTGEWFAEEAGATFTLAAEGGQLVIRQRPSTRIAVVPLYRDHFGDPRGGQVVWFTRDANGRVTRMHMGLSRLRDMPFVRTTPRGQP